MPAANDSETPRRSTPVYARLMRPHRTCIITAKSATASRRAWDRNHAGVEASYVSEPYILQRNIVVKRTEELHLNLWKTTPTWFHKNAAVYPLKLRSARQFASLLQAPALFLTVSRPASPKNKTGDGSPPPAQSLLHCCLNLSTSPF